MPPTPDAVQRLEAQRSELQARLVAVRDLRPGSLTERFVADARGLRGTELLKVRLIAALWAVLVLLPVPEHSHRTWHRHRH